MQSAIPEINILTSVCTKVGIKYIVFSPGSRNAPLIISFANDSRFHSLCIPDERSAAFFALGMALQLNEPAAICCTSGSAALNYAPAIAEAYYQRIPLLVLTADRPKLLIDQADGQAIRQKNIYHDFIKAEYQLEESMLKDLGMNAVVSLIQEAIHNTKKGHCGPVHINIPLNEPLYQTIEEAIKLPELPISAKLPILQYDFTPLKKLWTESEKKLILIGAHKPNSQLNSLLADLTSDESVIILTETIANVYHSKFIDCIDRTITTIGKAEIHDFIPDILVTLGEIIVSKKIKQLFREHKPKHHWNINPTPEKPDTYFSLTKNVEIGELEFLKNLTTVPTIHSDYQKSWQKKNVLALQKHNSFIQQAPYSDLLIFNYLLENLPENCDLHLANSTPVRYAQLFNHKTYNYYSNRGVSGIDGCTSTAAGASMISTNPTVLITGDMAFLYDSNALWNNYLKSDFRIVVINNRGGGIFRFIPGPASTPQLETFFQAKHDLNTIHLCKQFAINRFEASLISDLETVFKKFMEPSANNRPSLLEIYTPMEVNDKVLKDYFKNISN